MIIFLSLNLTILLLITTCCPIPEIVEWEVEKLRYTSYNNALWIYIADRTDINGYYYYLDSDLDISFNSDTYSEIIDIGDREIESIGTYDICFDLDFVTPPLTEPFTVYFNTERWLYGDSHGAIFGPDVKCRFITPSMEVTFE